MVTIVKNKKEFKGNLSLLYYKDYYKNEGGEFLDDLIENDNSKFKKGLKEKNEQLCDFKFEEKEILNNIHINTVYLKTIYPGLLIGSGYMHETKTDGEFKLGFEFDYTSGLPIIPGSAVKGVLRSVFPEKKGRYKKEKEKYIKKLLKKIFEDNANKRIKNIDVYELKAEIFDGLNKEKKRLNRYQRDVFFPAKIVKSKYQGKNGKDKFRIIGEDYITPHPDLLKDPTPLKFLKVLPNVVFEFKFILRDGIISSKEKEELFKKIILDFGMGAKTNVGYGQFEVVTNKL